MTQQNGKHAHLAQDQAESDVSEHSKRPRSPRALRIATVALLAVMIIMSLALWFLSTTSQHDQVQRGIVNAGSASSEQLFDDLVSDLRAHGTVVNEAELEIAVQGWLDEQQPQTIDLAAGPAASS